MLSFRCGSRGNRGTIAETAEESAAVAAAGAASKIYAAIAKLNKFIKEYFAIDAVLKSANAIIHAVSGVSKKFQRLERYISVLTEMEN